jgi:glyoxylate/hydroxypyruvate reductase
VYLSKVLLQITVKIFVYTDLSFELRSKLTADLKGHEVVFKSSVSAEAPADFNTAEILFGNPPKSWFDTPQNLKFWQLDSAGFDQYSSIKANFPVANMGDFFSAKCAETMVGGLLAFYRNIHELVRLQVQTKWVGKPLRYEMDMLSGKKVIILGSGTIARCIKKMLSGFDCTVLLTARKDAIAQIHSREELFTQLATCALVINTLPGKANRYADVNFFNAMVEGSVYASVGRGNTTDEASLIHSLETGKLAGAVLDVTEQEPLPVDNPLWTMTNVILTQHTGGGYKFEDEGKLDMFVKNLNHFLNGEAIENVVNLSEGY